MFFYFLAVRTNFVVLVTLAFSKLCIGFDKFVFEKHFTNVLGLCKKKCLI